MFVLMPRNRITGFFALVEHRGSDEKNILFLAVEHTRRQAKHLLSKIGGVGTSVCLAGSTGDWTVVTACLSNAIRDAGEGAVSR